jgi:hypothetical protein
MHAYGLKAEQFSSNVATSATNYSSKMFPSQQHGHLTLQLILGNTHYTKQ